MGRAPCCDKANVKRGPWSPEEDAALRSYFERNGTGGNWIALPRKAGLRRCGKSCRLRWLNYLRPNIKHGGFTEEEDNIIYTLYKNIGSRWSVIASRLPGRTDNDVKNYWNTKLKKKLMVSNSSQGKLTDTSITSAKETLPLPPLVPNTLKTEDNFFANPFDWGSGIGQYSYRVISELPPLPMPAITNTTPENSSVASFSVENWSTSGYSCDDAFLSEAGFESYNEFDLSGYGEITKPPGLYQMVSYS